MHGSITQSHLTLISNIYDLPLRPDGWQAVLDEFAPMMNASIAGLAMVDPKYADHQINASSSGFEILQSEEYRSRFSRDTGYQSAFARMAANPKRGFVGDLDMLGLNSVEEYTQRPMVQWLQQNCNIFRGMSSCLNLERAWSDILFVMFSDDRGPCTAAEMQTGNLFLDHFAKAVEIGRAFNVLKSRFQGVLTALDRVHIGICVLSSDGSVVLRNSEASRILDAKDSLALSREGRLHLSDELLREELKVATGRAADTAQAQDSRAESLLTVPRRSGEDPYLIEVSPFRDDDELDSLFRGALVYIIDPSRADMVSIEGMQALYGLTPSESEVCRLVAEGLATDQIADTRNLTRETVRNYIKQVLQKTGTNNRSQLVRLALSVNLPIDPAAEDNS